MRSSALVVSALLPLLALPGPAHAQAPGAAEDAVPRAASLLGEPESDLAAVVRRFADDRAALFRRYDAEWSPERRERLRSFYAGWREELRTLDFAALGLEDRVDWVLLDNELRYRLHELDREEALFAEMRPLLPFAGPILALHRARRALEPLDPRGAAARLTELAEEVEALRGDLSEGMEAGEGPTPIVGLRAADAVASVTRTLDRWYDYYAGYDPLFTWWVEQPHEELSAALEAYEDFLRREVVGYEEGEDPPIVGDPIGADGLAADLRHEMIPYSPAELIEIAEREYAWCEARMIEASRELGFGDDWLAAVEHVKTLHVAPGEQPALILDLYRQSVEFIEERDLVTIPPLAEEVWRMEMMSPERQKVAPFFLGGEVILVSYPTAGMEHADKLMSMRGNNEHFSRAVVH
ncbi:MAG: DUF885 family protein, partial [Gemmatimonadetes bacterium]|nr:DUF885 domain-containing protein [Gemmatimonadota bacterium]NIQ58706.1 DUF885 domain-containing protein [Gemmatimonadota bacterium]NIU78894.1 DUF885 family protein [Gammaproteobacteria bacterium]NIX47659.1 DUF885 family protein [Gemmatimonadota bacterium]NIY12033.1 DUF885 family protein [Gemmatimonadota bacterium]